MSRVRDIRAFVAGRRGKGVKIHRYIVRSHFADIEGNRWDSSFCLELLALVL